MADFFDYAAGGMQADLGYGSTQYSIILLMFFVRLHFIQLYMILMRHMLGLLCHLRGAVQHDSHQDAAVYLVRRGLSCI